MWARGQNDRGSQFFPLADSNLRRRITRDVERTTRVWRQRGTPIDDAT